MDGFEDRLSRFNTQRRAAAEHNLAVVIENINALGIYRIQASFSALGDYEMELADRVCQDAGGGAVAWPEALRLSGLQKAVGDPRPDADVRIIAEEDPQPLAGALERLNRELLDTEVADWEETAYSSGSLRIDAGGVRVDAQLAFLKECDPAPPLLPEASPLPVQGAEDAPTAQRRMMAHNLATLLEELAGAGLSGLRAGFHGHGGARRVDRMEFLRDGAVAPMPTLRTVEGLQTVDATGGRAPAAGGSAAAAAERLVKDLLAAEPAPPYARDGVCGEVSVTFDGAEVCLLGRSFRRVRFDVAPVPGPAPDPSRSEPEI